MKSLLRTAAAILALAAFAVAQDVGTSPVPTSAPAPATQPLFITAPIKTTVWRAGQTVTVAWDIRGAAPPAGRVPIVLMSGDPQALTTLSTVGETDPNSRTFSWEISRTLTSGSNYALAFQTNPVSYTDQFTIAADGVLPPGNSTTGTGTLPSATRSSSSIRPSSTANSTIVASPGAQGSGSFIAAAQSTFALVALLSASLLAAF